MRELNKRILHLDIPSRMRHLPISDEGYPIPYFVPKVNGKYDFRGMDGQKLGICIRNKKCWLCGDPLGKFMTFVIGPMCAINKTSSEPPSHRSCAEYGAKACPFLTQPRMRRNEKDPLEGEVAIMIKRNPGVTLLWTTMEYRMFLDHQNQVPLFTIGNPTDIKFYREGRIATREEILESIDTGMPELMRLAELEGPEAVTELNERYKEALTMF
jgi:hypothetical protein